MTDCCTSALVQAQEAWMLAAEAAGIHARSGRRGLALWITAAGEDSQLRGLRKSVAFPYMYGTGGIGTQENLRAALDS